MTILKTPHIIFSMMRIFLGSSVVTAMLLPWTGAIPDVTPRGSREVLWKDGLGRVIRHLDSNGQVTLINHDFEGKIIQLIALEGNYTPKTAAERKFAEPAWVHFFEYDSRGRLVKETDCVGEWHYFESGSAAKLDYRKGTALQGHRHVKANAKRD